MARPGTVAAWNTHASRPGKQQTSRLSGLRGCRVQLSQKESPTNQPRRAEQRARELSRSSRSSNLLSTAQKWGSTREMWMWVITNSLPYFNLGRRTTTRARKSWHPSLSGTFPFNVGGVAGRCASRGRPCYHSGSRTELASPIPLRHGAVCCSCSMQLRALLTVRRRTV